VESLWRRFVSGVILALILIGMLTLMSNVRHAKGEWTGTVYIRADGCIDPLDAPIQRNGDIYTLTGNITSNNDAVIIERDNIVLDGAGYTIKTGETAGYFVRGITIQSKNNITISNVKVTGFYDGIYSINSSYSCYIANELGCKYGIHIINSHNNNISRNTGQMGVYYVYLENSNYSFIDNNILLTREGYGIVMLNSHNNFVTGNYIKNVEWGISLSGSNNIISENYFIDIQLDSIIVSGSQNRIKNNYMNSSIYSSCGVSLNGIENVVSGNVIDVDDQGIEILPYADQNVICNNIIEGCEVGILLKGSRIAGEYPFNNKIFANTIKRNWHGVNIVDTSINYIYHNNFVDNTLNVYIDAFDKSVNVWDDGYPSGGNFWSNYVGKDVKSGPYQNQTGSDGIGDNACIINSRNQDRYPLKASFNKFDAGVWNGEFYNVNVISNSSISDFHFNPDEGPFLKFNVTGNYGTSGFCRIAIPKSLLWTENGWTITVGGQPITDYNLFSDENFTYLYFTYNHSTQTVIIQGTNAIPEFSSPLSLAMLILTTLITLIILKAKRKRQPP
jgi:parallel beta-helix repeat protein